MAEVIIYDTEYWTQDGAPKRNWDGLTDQPPMLVQVGAFKVKLENGLPILSDYLAYVMPYDAAGRKMGVTSFFSELTQIQMSTLEKEGRRLSDVLAEFKEFTGDLPMYSYGRDMLRCIAVSCYVERTACPFDPLQARDIRQILKRADVSEQDILQNSSGTIATHFGLSLDSHYAHDARNDAMSIIAALRYLQEQGRLDDAWFYEENL